MTSFQILPHTLFSSTRTPYPPTGTLSRRTRLTRTWLQLRQPSRSQVCALGLLCQRMGHVGLFPCIVMLLVCLLFLVHPGSSLMRNKPGIGAKGLLRLNTLVMDGLWHHQGHNKTECRGIPSDEEWLITCLVCLPSWSAPRQPEGVPK